MNSENDIIDVNYEDIENEMYLTAPQVAQKINDTDIRVRHWADSFGDIIGIEKVNGRKRYKESDVPKFAFVKDLLDNKNFTHEQARIYLSKHGFQYAEFKSGLINPQDPLGFQALASALSVEVDNKLNKFQEQFISSISDKLIEYLTIQKQMNTEMKAEIESSVDEIVTEKLDTKLKEFSITLDAKEQEAKNRDIELLDTLRKGMEDRKRESEIKESQKKGFWVRLFKR